MGVFDSQTPVSITFLNVKLILKNDINFLT